jgi:ribosomal protein S18 acetylase RimI-like enzyme
MSTTLVLTDRDFLVREMDLFDLPQVLTVENQTSAPRWTWQTFLRTFQELGGVGRVIEIGDRIAAFMVYRATREPVEIDVSRLRKLLGTFFPWTAIAWTGGPLRIDLLNLAVAPNWQRQGLGRRLLSELDELLHHPDDAVHALVPETNLGMQLFLRHEGYRATRVLRDYYGGEDAYLMERHPEVPAAVPVTSP